MRTAVAPGEDGPRLRRAEAEEPYGVPRALRDEKCVRNARVAHQCLRLLPAICTESALAGPFLRQRLGNAQMLRTGDDIHLEGD